jgi:hypothetical protein|eukprot:COSAG01_NODE_11993_length_1820_cov_1.872167_2_plen_167_part_00
MRLAGISTPGLDVECAGARAGRGVRWAEGTQRLGREITEAEVDDAMAFMDADGSGAVDFDEFAKWWRTAFPSDTEVQSRDGNGWSALMHAAELNHKQLHVQRLIAAGADVNVKSLHPVGIFPAGSTALDIARRSPFTLLPRCLPSPPPPPPERARRGSGAVAGAVM